MASGGLSGLPIARVFGITIRIHASWLLIFFLMALIQLKTDLGGHWRPGGR